jgi:site-specific DNA-methyltransferase (adenine-specific)
MQLNFKDFPTGRFYNEDCFDAMREIPDGVIDMILCDLPYGTTYAKWDSVLPLDKLWAEYIRLTKDNGAIVLTCSQPFTSQLIMSKPELFRHEWIWDKKNPANFANANIGPLKQHENVIVFGKSKVVYNPIKVQGKPNHSQGKNANKNISETRLITDRVDDDLSGMKFPKSIIEFPKHSSQMGLHPTQKPIALFEYLIKTYTDENQIVLDNTAGSGTTAIAAINTNRKWVCIEKKPKTKNENEDRDEFYKIAIERLEAHASKL